MISEGTRQFDLYDFFSILIPGAAFLIGAAPFLPNDVSFPATAALGLILILGFVFGRGIHAIRLWIEDELGSSTHRQQFISEMLSPNLVSSELTDEFYTYCRESFDNTDLPENRADLNEEDHADDLNSLYSLVRSTIHMDSRGRSRTFQAVYDFYGSMWVASMGLVYGYLYYSLLHIFNVLNGDSIGYTSYIGELNVDATIIFLAALSSVGVAYVAFKKVRTDYRNLFVQYLMTDFIIIQKTDP